MLSISKPIRGPGQGDYYLGLASSDDYYLDGEEPPGFWLGQGAAALGLVGTLVKNEFRQVFRGWRPDGTVALVRNADSKRRRTGWDLTWSVPKSVSTAWSQSPLSLRAEMETVVYQAVAEGVRYLENIGLVIRRGENGVEREVARLVFAAFPHSTSRAQDPQLHVHTILLNVAVRADGSTGTIDPRVMFRHQHAADAVFRAELAAQLQQRLGFPIARVGRAFEIAGVDRGLMAAFSRRRQEIVRTLEERGLSGARAAEAIAFETRARKVATAREPLFVAWLQQGREHGWSTPQVCALARGPQPERDHRRDQQQLARRAIQRLVENESHFALRDVTRALGDEAQGYGLGAQVVHAARRDLIAGKRLIPLGTRHYENRFTIQEMLDLERDLLVSARALVERERPQTPGTTLGPASVDVQTTLSAQQRAAVNRVVHRQGGLQVICGMAGTGKSHAFRVARQHWLAQGFQPVAACLSGKAASGLQESSGIESLTIHRFLSEVAQGRRSLDSRSVIVLDEAAMVGTRHLREIVRHALAADAKLVLVGDVGQLQAIEPGGGFAALAEAHGAAHLTEILRQREEWARVAVKDFAVGNAGAALAAFDSRGLTAVAAEIATAEARLLSDWALDGLTDLRGRIILAGTNEQVNRLNSLAQERRRAAGWLPGEAHRVGAEQFYQGDRVLCLRNHLGLGVFNGDLGSVVALAPDALLVTLDNGRTVQINPIRYPHLRLGYALTTHKAQGMTVEQAYVLIGSLQSRELTYVQASRARGVTRFYVGGEDLGEVAARMQRAYPKELATDVARSAGPVLLHDLIP